MLFYEQDMSDHVKLFISEIGNQLAIIDAAQFTDRREVYQKTLYCCLLDAVATTISQAATHRERFTELILKHASWPTATKVSRPHLEALLAKTKEPAFDPVRAVLSQLGSFPSHNIVRATVDPDASQIGAVWPKDTKRKNGFAAIQGVDWAKLQHVQLLYSLRNRLVHESQTFGTTNPLPFTPEPYYHKLIDLDTRRESWTLNYPAEFVRRLWDKIVPSVEAHYRSNNIDPYAYFEFGEYWVQELND